MELGRIISLLIKRRNLTQVEVAKRIGKSTTALSQIINGTYNPNPDTLNKICKVLDVPLPVVYFLMISEDDVPEDNKEMYKLLAPNINDLLLKIFGIENEQLIKEFNQN